MDHVAGQHAAASDRHLYLWAPALSFARPLPQSRQLGVCHRPVRARGESQFELSANSAPHDREIKLRKHRDYTRARTDSGHTSGVNRASHMPEPMVACDVQRLAGCVPDCLRERRQWVAWRRVTRGNKTTKCPISPTRGGNASTTDPATWGTFDQAIAACQAAGTADAASRLSPHPAIEEFLLRLRRS